MHHFSIYTVSTTLHTELQRKTTIKLKLPRAPKFSERILFPQQLACFFSCGVLTRRVSARSAAACTRAALTQDIRKVKLYTPGARAPFPISLYNTRYASSRAKKEDETKDRYLISPPSLSYKGVYELLVDRVERSLPAVIICDLGTNERDSARSRIAIFILSSANFFALICVRARLIGGIRYYDGALVACASSITSSPLIDNIGWLRLSNFFCTGKGALFFG